MGPGAASGSVSGVGEARFATGPRTARVRELLSRPALYGSLIPAVSLANAVAGLIVPMLITPAVFAQYALVVTFFQYGLIFDLGASQLADRVLPALFGRGEAGEADSFGQHLLWFRIAVSLASFVTVAAGMASFAAAGRLPFDLGAGLLSAVAGLNYMVALGPACIYRARSQRRNYAVSVAVLSFGLVVARTGGLALGGIDGCFLALAMWYLGFAALFIRLMPPRAASRPSLHQLRALAGRGSPLFATSFLWAFYVTANRWIASAVISTDDFVAFAFGANILTLLVGALGGLSALWYPAKLEAFAREGRSSSRMAHELALLIGGAAVLAVCGAVAARFGIGLLFPQFNESIPTVRMFLAAMPVVALASWLMPVSLSVGRRPWIEGLILYPVATAALGVGIPLGYAAFGVEGAALASAASGLLLSAMQLVLLVDAGVLSVRESAALEAVAGLATVCLGLLALALP
jgi:O-antigen/teichoic acid export membrane protein